ncbi:MAG TPA: ester cyclase family protein [Anaerolineae bacterium]
MKDRPVNETHLAACDDGPNYDDIVDYVVRSTHRIWEEKAVGLIYTHYRHNCSVHTAYGLTRGREQVVAGTVQSLAAFPDHKLFADDVIWTGDDRAGYHTSHLFMSVAHNTGYSAYGSPTGRRVVSRVIANRFVVNDVICEEWQVRDELAVVRQLGIDEHEAVERLTRYDSARRVSPPSPGSVERGVGQLAPDIMPPKTGEGFDVEDFVRRSFHEIWNWRLFNKIKEYYSPAFIFHGPSGRHTHGLDDFSAYVISLLAAFPDARIDVDHIYWLDDAGNDYRVATRWTLTGTHEGPSVYGDPTGRRVSIMGISHHRIKGGRFVEEWTVFDELALLQQLWAPVAS